MSNNDRKQEYDIFKDSPIRYLGYSNEIGEAFRPLISRRLVAFSYLIEIIYFFSDTFHKGHKAYTNTSEDENKVREMAKATSHTIVWQFFASVAIPAFTINRVVRFCGILANKYSNNKKIQMSIPTLVGLMIIPILPSILDPMVDKSIESVIKSYNSYKNI